MSLLPPFALLRFRFGISFNPVQGLSLSSVLKGSRISEEVYLESKDVSSVPWFYEMVQLESLLLVLLDCWYRARSRAARSRMATSCRWSRCASAWSMVSCCFFWASSSLLRPDDWPFIDIAIARSMALFSSSPLLRRKTQLWSEGNRCLRQTTFAHESHFCWINSRVLHFGAQHLPSFFFWRFLAAAWESQSRSMCSLTNWSMGLSPLPRETGLLHKGQVGTWRFGEGEVHLWAS